MTTTQTAALVFVADDDRGLLRLAAKALEREGFAVATGLSGAETLAWLKKNRPDLLLLDLKLQDADARQVIRQLAEIQRLPPFVIITGQGDERVAVEMMKSGARDYLVKDAGFLEHLPAVVRRALAQIEQERKLAEAQAALRVSEERFRVALKNSPIMVFNQNKDLRYTWLHNETIMGAPHEMMGKTDAEVFPAEEADRLTQIKARVLVTGNGLRQEFARAVNGEKHFYDLTVESVKDASGNVIGITGAAMEVTERKRLEEEILHISELEQRRIGQDLHDGICQSLTAIELKTQSLAQILEKKAKGSVAQVEEIAGHVREVIAETRSLARGLSPFILESEGLVSALGELAVNAGKLFGVKCVFENDGQAAITDPATATHLYRIAQEAVTNAVKHGKAGAIGINLLRKNDNVVLTVSDNGIGLKSSSRQSAGMGLRIMQYRAGMIGAVLLVQAQPKGGARIVCFLPNTK